MTTDIHVSGISEYLSMYKSRAGALKSTRKKKKQDLKPLFKQINLRKFIQCDTKVT